MARAGWFRAYSRMIDDEKLRLLAFEDRWHFVALCCLKNEGLLDEPDTEMRRRKIAVRMGLQVRELDEVARRLSEVSLIDETLNPCAWDDLQFISDNSTERARAWRERQRKQRGNGAQRCSNGSATLQQRPKTQTQTQTDTVSSKDKTASKRARAPECPADVSASVWADFLSLRKAKRAPLTETALSSIRSEAVKAGWTVEAALTECVVRGWQGFKAEWVKPADNFGDDYPAGHSGVPL